MEETQLMFASCQRHLARRLQSLCSILKWFINIYPQSHITEIGPQTSSCDKWIQTKPSRLCCSCFFRKLYQWYQWETFSNTCFPNWIWLKLSHDSVQHLRSSLNLGIVEQPDGSQTSITGSFTSSYTTPVFQLKYFGLMFLKSACRSPLCFPRYLSLKYNSIVPEGLIKW